MKPRLKARRCGNPKHTRFRFARVFNKVHARRLEAEAGTAPHTEAAFAKPEHNAAREHIAELFPFVRIILPRAPAGHKRNEDGLKRVLLRVGNEPMDRMARFGVFLHEHIVRAEHNFFLRLLREEIRKVGAQRFEDVSQRCDGRGGEVALKLRDEALGKLRARGKLLLRQAKLDAPALDFAADIDQLNPSQ